MARVVIVRGPNGAGKTTAAMSLLAHDLHCEEFVNADAIAAGLSPFKPESVAFQAGRLMLKRIRELAAENRDFAFETTMAARSFVPFLARCRKSGYEIHLIFLWLASPELAVERVALRHRDGGHDIPESVVRRRYHAGLTNLVRLYIPMASAWVVYDNSGSEPRCIAEGSPGTAIISDEAKWRTIKDMIQ